MNTDEIGNIDLFEHPKLIPKEVKDVLESYEQQAIDGFSYEDLANLQNGIEALGYTFDYYLDAEPYNLRKK